MKSINEISDKVELFLIENGIAAGSHILAAWSGGPDSTAMLHILKNLKNFNCTVTAAWYNHGLRPQDEMSAEEKLVEAQAERFAVRLVKGAAGTGEIMQLASDQSLSIEEAARNARYDFLYSRMDELGADYIATGHNLNDNAETMLMRFLRNEGVAGLSGIPEKRGEIIRPLSRVGRKEIEEYLHLNKIEYSIDKTNSENDFMRNRIRNEVLPTVREAFPNVDGNLRSMSHKIGEYSDYIEAEAAEKLIWERTGNGWKINAKVFYREHRLLRIRSVFNILNKSGISERVKYTAVEGAAAGGNPGNGKILLKTSAFEISTYKGDILFDRLVNHNKKSYFIYIEPGKIYSFAGQKVFVLSEDSDDTETDGNTVSVEISGRTILRSCRDGDFISSPEGRKSLKKLFSDWKVSREDRLRIPIIEDRGGIAAVAGEHLGYDNRIEKRLKSGTSSKIRMVFNCNTELISE